MTARRGLPLSLTVRQARGAGRRPEWRQSEDMGPTARHRIQMKSYAELGAQVATRRPREAYAIWVQNVVIPARANRGPPQSH